MKVDFGGAATDSDSEVKIYVPLSSLVKFSLFSSNFQKLSFSDVDFTNLSFAILLSVRL